MRAGPLRAAATTDHHPALPPRALLLLAALAYALVAQGAFYRHQLLFGGAVLVAAALPVVARDPRRWLRYPPLLAAGGIAAAYAITGGVTGLEGSLWTLWLLAALAGAAVVTASLDRPARRQVVDGLLLAGAGVAALGCLGVALHLEPYAELAQGLWRASSTLTYTNATAGLLVALGLVALARTAGTPSTVHRLTAFLVLTGAGVTLSRAAALAGLVGLAVLAARLGFRTLLRSTAPVLVGAAVATAGIAASAPAARAPRPWLALSALALGAVIASRPALPRPALAGLLAVGLLAAASGSTPALVDARLDPSSQDRVDEWRAAVSLAAEQPLVGVGPDAAALRYDTPEGPRVALYAHNEYLQVLIEAGLVGLLTVAAALVLLARWLHRARRDWCHAGVVAALGAFLVHAGFDFLWHVPVLPLIAAVLLAAAGPVPDDLEAHTQPERSSS